MRTLFLCGREATYTRNDVLARALKRFGQVEVIDGGAQGSLTFRSMKAILRSIPRLLRRHYDLIVVGFYGYGLIFPARLLSYRKPLLFDAFVSNYDTLVGDRQQFRPGSILASLALGLDKTACRLADHILVDTPLHAAYFSQDISVAPEKISSLPVGCSEAVFQPQSFTPSADLTHVLYYTTFLPLHGVETVVRAAALLKDELAIRIKIIGSGPDYARVRRLADELNASNIVFVPPAPLDQIAREITAAHICLGGHFGTSAKAGRVVPGKVYQILAVGRPLIAAATPANEALLSDGENALLCPPDDPTALAAAIRRLHQDKELQACLAARSIELYRLRCSEEVIAAGLEKIIRKLPGLGR